MNIMFDTNEFELIAIAVDRYRHKLKRERHEVKIFLRKIRDFFGAEQAAEYSLYTEHEQKLDLIDVDLARCQGIHAKLRAGGVL